MIDARTRLDDTANYISYHTRDHISPSRGTVQFQPPVDPGGLRGAEIRQLMLKSPMAVSGTQLPWGPREPPETPGSPRQVASVALIGECTFCSVLPLPRYMWTPQGRQGSKLRTARMMSMPTNLSGPFSSKIGVFWTESS